MKDDQIRRMAQEHRLKTWPEYFEAILDGRKRFEIRVNDRNFQVGDTLVLQEWYPDLGVYSGRSLSVQVRYIAQGVFGLPENVCVISFELAQPTPQHTEPFDIRWDAKTAMYRVSIPNYAGGKVIAYEAYAALHQSHASELEKRDKQIEELKCGIIQSGDWTFCGMSPSELRSLIVRDKEQKWKGDQ